MICTELKTRFVELLKAKQAFDVAYADKSTVTGAEQIERWSVLRKVTKTLRNSRDGLIEAKDLKSNMEIWQEIAQGNFSRMYLLTLLSDTAAEHLSRHQGWLTLSGLTKLSDTAAEHLSRHQGWLTLSGLTKLSDTAAEHLSRHQGTICLNGLTKLSDTAAEHLSRHQGTIGLNGLTKLSDTAAEHLSRHQGTIDLSGLTKLSDTAAEHLSRHKGYLDVPKNIQAQIDRFEK